MSLNVTITLKNKDSFVLGFTDDGKLDVLDGMLSAAPGSYVLIDQSGGHSHFTFVKVDEIASIKIGGDGGNTIDRLRARWEHLLYKL